jgi:glutamine synthetase
MTSDIHQFFRERGISEVEAIVPDMAGIARGKIMPAQKFAADEGMKLPESIFLQTVTGDYPVDTSSAMSPAEIDIVLKPDSRTVRVVPWTAEPTAQVIHDCFYSDGRPGRCCGTCWNCMRCGVGSRWWRRNWSST